MLPRAVAFQRFQSIPGRHAQIVQSPRDLQLPQLAASDGGNVCKRLTDSPLESACVSAHLNVLITKLDSNAMRD